MARQYYSDKHYRLLSNGGPDTADTIAARERLKKAMDAAKADMAEKYPRGTITPDNFVEADELYRARLAYYRKLWNC